MDVVIRFLQLPYTVLFFNLNIFGYNVSLGSILIWVALVTWLWEAFCRLFE